MLNYLDEKEDTQTQEIEQALDPRAKRKTHYTMKVNDYDLALMDKVCESLNISSRASLIRVLVNEKAKQEGLF